MQITTIFKIAKPSNTAWSGVFGHRPEDRLSQHKFGELFAVMSLSAEVGFEAQTIAGLLFDHLQTTYFDPTVEEVDIVHFEHSLTAVKSRVAEILEREPELADQGLDIELAAVAVRGEVLYVGVVGESRIMINRGDDYAEISGALIDSEGDGFLRSGSLFTQADDRIALTTSNAFEQHTGKSWKQALADFSLGELAHDQGAALFIGNQVVATPVVADPEPVKAEEVVAPEVKIPQPAVVAESASKTDSPSEVIDPEDTEDRETDADFDSETEDADLDAFEDEAETIATAGPSRKEKLQKQLQNARATAGSLFSRVKQALVMKKETYDEEFEDLDAEGDAIPHRRFASEEEDEEVEEDEVPYRSAPSFAPASGIRGRLLNAGDRVRSYDYRGAGSRIGNFLRRLWVSFQTAIYTVDASVNRLSGRNQYARGQRRLNTRFWAVVVVICLILLVFGVRSALLERDRSARVEALNTQITALERRFSTAGTAADVAALSTDVADKEQAITDLSAISTDAAKLNGNPDLTPEMTQKLEELQDKVASKKDGVVAAHAFTEPQVITDFVVYFNGANTTDIQYLNGQIYVVDRTRSVIYRVDVNLESEPGEFITGFNSPYLLSSTPEGDLVVIDQNGDSVVATIDVDSKEVKRHPGLSLARIGSLAAAFVWDNNGAFYNINPVKQSLFRQEAIAGNYQLPNDGAPWRLDADFSNAQDIVVDGSIYVLIKGKGMQRYFDREPASFEVKGLISADAQAILNSSAFELNGEDLFIADNEGKRIFHFKRNVDSSDAVFDYAQQFDYRGSEDVLTNVRDLVYNVQARKLYILDGTKVLRLDV